MPETWSMMRSNQGRGNDLVKKLRRFHGAIFLTVLTFLLLPNAAVNAKQAPIRIVALGDSITAGYGLSPEQSFPVQLEAALKARGVNTKVINAGVSGDTTAGGLARVGDVIRANPKVVIVELGANDGLRGIDPETTYSDLDGILTQLAQRHIRVLLTGMYAPPNLGREFGAEFDAVFTRLAKEHGVAFYPFFLKGVAANAKLNQDDGIHPNAAGVRVIVKNILPYLLPLLKTSPRDQ